MIKKRLKTILRKFWNHSKKLGVSALKKHWPLLLASAVLFVLLFRNPYNNRTLIPNFEPFPDTFHYVTVARCFLARGEWILCRDGIQHELPGAKPSVPQAYSLALIPGFMYNFDPRTFYYSNVVLSFVSLMLLYGILKRVTHKQSIQLFVLAVVVTSYHVYWLPTLAMAENLLIPLYLLGAYLLILQKSKKQLVALGLVATAIYFTKYAYVPLSGSLLLFAGIAILSAQAKFIKKPLQLIKKAGFDLLFLIVPVVALLPFSHNFSNSVKLLEDIFLPKSGLESTPKSGTGTYFSLQTVQKYLPDYLNIYLGKPARFLWDVRPWYPQLIGIGGMLGLLAGLMTSKKRLIAGFLLVSSISQAAFMATFYAFDSRYVYSGFFAIAIGFALLLDHISERKLFHVKIKKMTLTPRIIAWLLVAMCSVVILVPRVSTIKSQVGINLKYAETPWWYLSVLDYNSFFATRREEQPQLITLTSPFMIDYYSNNTYTVLPFDEQQDFNNQKDTVWGIPKEQLLVDTYRSKLEAGENLYISNYGIEATNRFKSTFAQYQTLFDLEKVQEGCYNLCNIYRVSLPADPAE